MTELKARYRYTRPPGELYIEQKALRRWEVTNVNGKFLYYAHDETSCRNFCRRHGSTSKLSRDSRYFDDLKYRTAERLAWESK